MTCQSWPRNASYGTRGGRWGTGRTDTLPSRPLGRAMVARRATIHRHRIGYQLAQVRVDGSVQSVSAPIWSWQEVPARAKLLVTTLHTELERGNPEVGG